MTRSRRFSNAKSNRKRHRRLFCEPLEDRSLLAPVVVWDEAVNGDLPASGTLPNLQLVSGPNEVRGNIGESPTQGDFDGFVIQVPSGNQLTSISFSATRTTGMLELIGW